MLKWIRHAEPSGIGSCLFIVLLLVVAGLGHLVYGVDPRDLSVDALTAPSPSHPLGTDDLGRDVLAGLIEGAGVSLLIGVTAAATTTLIGISVGAVAGFSGGWLDTALMRVSEIFQVMPTFILATLVVALLGPGLVQTVAVIALLYWPQTARVARGEVLRVARLEYVDAVRCLGIPKAKILLSEVAPNAVAPSIALSTLIVADAILLESSLSFLGLSQPDVISWGRMLSIGQQYLFSAWWLSVFPGLAIFLTVLAFNLAGDFVRDLLDPRKATRRS